MKKIPDYYRQYQKAPGEQPRTSRPPSPPGEGRPAAGPIPPPQNLYTGQGFTLRLYDDWRDKTVYSITGPVTDGIQHNITVSVEPDVATDNLKEYAEWNLEALEGSLKSCRILKQEETALKNGTPAYRAIYKWYPTEDKRIFQEMILVLVDKTGYKLTATFTKKTRKTLGPQVERMMLSFEPKPLP